jgi:hypothetical protein
MREMNRIHAPFPLAGSGPVLDDWVQPALCRSDDRRCSRLPGDSRFSGSVAYRTLGLAIVPVQPLQWFSA